MPCSVKPLYIVSYKIDEYIEDNDGKNKYLALISAYKQTKAMVKIIKKYGIKSYMFLANDANYYNDN